MISNFLVPGGGGFIGSHLVDRLVAEGLEVVVFDDLSAGHVANLSESADRITFIKGDICDGDALAEAGAGCGAIFHLAAVANVSQSLSEPIRVHAVNATGTLNVCEVARTNRAKVIFCSSAATYGNQLVMPVTESARQEPISLYGVQKMLGEHYLRVYGELFSVPSIALRYFNVFGPRQDPSSPYSGVISIFIDRLKFDQPLTIFGDGGQYRDFVYVSDVVEANWLAFSRHERGHAAFNIGRGEQTSILELAQKLAEILGVEARISNMPVREGDIRESVSDPRAIELALNWKAKVTVQAGLRATV